MKAVLFNPFSDYDEFRAAMAAFPQVDFQIADDEAALAALLPGAEILVTSNRIYTEQPAALIRRHGSALRWIQFVTSGTDKAVANGMPSGVVVTNVAGLRAFCVAEHAFALMLALVRDARGCALAFAAHDWARNAIEARVDNLAGKHLVIVGVGAIGRDIARKAQAFDMLVTGVSRDPQPMAHFDAMAPRAALIETARAADILLVAATADAQSDRLISRAVIAALPTRAFVINIARGSLIDEDALVEALRARRIAGAGLDVQAMEPTPPDHPLWSLDNVVLTPHVAGVGSKGTGATHASMFADNLRLWLAGAPLEKVVFEKTP